MGGNRSGPRPESAPVGDAEYFELLAEARRLRRLGRIFYVGFWAGAPIAATLILLGLFWIGFGVTAVATASCLLWIDLVREPGKRFIARDQARTEAVEAKRKATGQSSSA